MRLATVIPIARGVFKDDLTYFTSRDISPGALVTVPLRNKTISALVVNTEPIAEHKADIKNATFGLKAIKRVIADTFYSPEFIAAAQAYATFAACPPGAVIKQFSPRALLEGRVPGAPSTDASTFGAFEEVAIQAAHEERFGFYKSFIREEFAKKRSVFFILPTIADLFRVAPALTRGIEEYTVLLHSELSTSDLSAAWKRALDTQHPMLVVATPSFISLPRRDIGAIIIERESSPYWKQQARPYLDARHFANFLAIALKTRVVWGDLMLRVETLWRSEHESFVTLLPLKFRSLSQATCAIVDLRKTPKLRDRSIAGLSTEAVQTLTQTITERKNALIYVHRKGLASTTVCDDCGSIVSCDNCGAPLVLHSSKEYNVFLCHKCWKESSADIACATCSSWRLTPLGVGIEKIRNELVALFPETPLFSLDGDSVSTNKQAREIIDEFYATPGALLVGTDMMIPYIREPVDTTIIGTIDSLFSIPDFRMNEKIFHTILALRSYTERTCIIQTRNPARKLFTSAAYGTLVDFYREEMSLRTKLKYPPITTLIKITREGKEDEVERDMKTLHGLLREWEPLVFPSFTHTDRGIRLHALIKIERAEWPHKKLSSILTSLSPNYVIHIDPDDII